MIDSDLANLLGRMEQTIDDIKNDIKEIKEEQKRLTNYVNTQKIGLRVFVGVLTTLGGAFIYFKEHLSAYLFGKIPN